MRDASCRGSALANEGVPGIVDLGARGARIAFDAPTSYLHIAQNRPFPPVERRAMLAQPDLNGEVGMTASRLVLAVTLTTGLLAAPLAQAQQVGKVYRIGILGTRTNPTFSPASDPHDKAFLDGLQELGYILGQNLAIEVRTIRDPDGPGALVASKVDVILAPNPDPKIAHATRA
jgi:hypothetical protein